MKDGQIGLASPCLGCAGFNGRKCGVGKVGRCQYLSRRRGPRHKNGTMRIANDMLRSVAQNMETPGIDFPSDDHGSCSDAFGGTEYSCVHRALFDLNPCLGRFPIYHRSNAFQKSIANRTLQLGALQSVVKMQLRKQGPHSKDLGQDVTDGKFDVVGMRKGVRLTKEIIGSIIEIHRGKNWTFDLKHDVLVSEKVSEQAPYHSSPGTPTSGQDTQPIIIETPQ